MKKAYYACEAFPWAGLRESLTLSGLLRFRTTNERQAWGLVLQGSDEQLVEALMTFDLVSLANNGVTEEVVRAFCKWIVKAGRFEEVVNNYEGYQKYSCSSEPWSTFLDGYKAGVNSINQPTKD